MKTKITFYLTIILFVNLTTIIQATTHAVNLTQDNSTSEKVSNNDEVVSHEQEFEGSSKSEGIVCEGRNGTINPVEIFAPKLDYPHLIPVKVTPGMSIRVEGEPEPSGSLYDFGINLVNGAKSSVLANNILIHLGARRHQPTRLGAVLNSYFGGWGQEEGPQDKLVFASCQLFEVLITFATDHAKIFINGQNFVNYKYRGGGMSQISHLFINGATFYKIRFEPGPLEPKSEDQVKILELKVKAMEKCSCSLKSG